MSHAEVPKPRTPGWLSLPLAAFPVVGPIVAWLGVLLILCGAPYGTTVTVLLGLLFCLVGMVGGVVGLTAPGCMYSIWEDAAPPSRGIWLVLEICWAVFGGIIAMVGFGSLALLGLLVTVVALALRGFSVAG